MPRSSATCSVCLRAVVFRNGLFRHGFSVQGQVRGHGLQGAWHTGPCAGWNFPHLGVSTKGTEWALETCRDAVEATNKQLTAHAARPALTHEVHVRRPGEPAKPVFIEVKPGEAPNYFPNTAHPGYEHLWARRQRELEARLQGLKSDIVTYEKIIAEWTPGAYPVAEVADVKAPLTHAPGRQAYQPACRHVLFSNANFRIVREGEKPTCTKCQAIVARRTQKGA